MAMQKVMSSVSDLFTKKNLGTDRPGMQVASKEKSTSFQSIMSMQTGKQLSKTSQQKEMTASVQTVNEKSQQNNIEPVEKNLAKGSSIEQMAEEENLSDAKVTEDVKTVLEAQQYDPKGDNEVVLGENEICSRETLQVLNKCQKKLQEFLIEQLDVSVEDLEEAMEELGISLMNLQNLTSVQQLVLYVTGENDKSLLLTNESLATQVQQILKEVENIVMDFASESFVSEEEFVGLFEKMEANSLYAEELSATEKIEVATLTVDDMPDSKTTEQILPTSNTPVQSENVSNEEGISFEGVKIVEQLQTKEQLQAEPQNSMETVGMEEAKFEAVATIETEEKDILVQDTPHKAKQNNTQETAKFEVESEKINTVQKDGKFIESFEEEDIKNQTTEMEISKASIEDAGQVKQKSEAFNAVGVEQVAEVEHIANKKESKNVENDKGLDVQKTFSAIKKNVENVNSDETAGSKQNNDWNNRDRQLSQKDNLSVMDQFVNHLAGNRITGTEQMEMRVEIVEQMREIVQQVVDQVKMVVTENTSSMEMQLNPENLGKVQLTVVSKAGHITAQFIAENEMAKQALESQIQQLRETLGNQGLKVEEVEVSVSDFSFHHNNQANAEQQKEQYRSSHSRKAMRMINLNDIDGLEQMSEEERIATDMLRRQGNQVDYTA